MIWINVLQYKDALKVRFQSLTLSFKEIFI